MPSIKVRELEHEHGDLDRVIPALVNECGQLGAALRLGVSTATISRWLNRNGYERRVVWVRNQKKAEAEARRKLQPLLDMLIYGPDGGAGADMLEVAHEADKLTAWLQSLESEDLEKPE